MKTQTRIIALTLFIAFALLVLPSITNAATNVIVTLDNTQGTATTLNMPQMVNINTTNSIWPPLRGDLGNIRFYYYANEIYSWCESNCTNTTKDATFWVELPFTIPGTSTANIVASLQSISTEYDGVYAGEAPQLSPIYGEYDNGNSVFTFYSNFSGHSLSPTAFVTDPCTGTSGYIQNNGITLVGGSVFNICQIQTAATFTNPIVVESYVIAGQPTQNYGGATLMIGCEYQCSGGAGYQLGYNYASSLNWVISRYGGGQNVGTSQPGLNGVMSALWISTGSEALYYNYTLKNAGTDSTQSLQPTFISIFTQGYSSASYDALYQWLRARQYPPDGVMPTVTFTPLPPPPSPTSPILTIATNPTTYGMPDLITATPVSSIWTIGSWTVGPPLPQAEYVAACTSITNYMYCAGVSTNFKDVYRASLTNNVLGSWIPQNSLPQVGGNPGGACFTTNNNYIWCIGLGVGSMGAAGAPITNNVIGTWAAPSNTPSSTINGDCLYYSSNIYCSESGGTNGIETASLTNNVIGTWSMVANTPPQSSVARCFNNNNYIYCTAAFPNSNSIYGAPITGGVIGTWTAEPTLPTTDPEGTCLAADSTAFCFGAFNAVSNQQTFAAPISSGTIGTWMAATPMLMNMTNEASCTVENNYVYCMQGSLNATNVTNYAPLQEYSVDTVNLGYCTGSGSCPSPTILASGIGTQTYTICDTIPSAANCFAAGTYTVIANDITAMGTNSVILTINQDTPIFSLTNCTNTEWLYLFAAPSCKVMGGFTASDTSLAEEQITGNLYLDDNLVNSTSGTNTISNTIPANTIGNFTYVFNSIATQNYTANSVAVNFFTYPALYVQNAITNTTNLNPPTFANMISDYYPIRIATRSPSPTLQFSLNYTYGTNSPVVVATAQPNLSYVPSPNSTTGIYKFRVKIQQPSNPMSSPLYYVETVNTLNMTSLTGSLTFNNPIIQDYSNAMYCPTWTIKPHSWYLQSDAVLNTRPNQSNPCLDIWSNDNLSFYGKLFLSYNGFPIFQANALNNLPLQTPITQNALFPSFNTITPPAPNTRVLLNISTWDEQFDTSLNATTGITFTMRINNHTSGPFHTAITANDFKVYLPKSNFYNPPVFVFNASTTSTASLHYQAINNFCAALVNNGTDQNYQPNLVNTANGTQFFTYQIYTNGGYGGYNDTMIVQTGTSPSSVRQVQSYLIQPGGVPFNLARETANSQQYRYVFLNGNCTPIYTSALTVWSNPASITLPNSANIPSFLAPQINATCSQYNFTVGNTLNGYELCSGIDTRNFVQSWNIQVLKLEPLVSVVVNSVTINGASFLFNWTIPNMSQQYVVKVSANIDLSPQTSFVGSWAINNLFASRNLPIYAFIYGIFLILVAIFGTGYDMRVGIPASVAALLVGQYLQIYNLLVTSFFAIVLVAIIAMFYLYSRQEQGG